MSNHHIDFDNVRFSPKVLRLGIGGVIVIIVIVVLATQFVKSVPAGHVSVATLFGDDHAQTAYAGSRGSRKGPALSPGPDRAAPAIRVPWRWWPLT